MAEQINLICLAMFAGECWYMDFVRHAKGKYGFSRKYGIYARTRAVVLHDRVLCGDRPLVAQEGKRHG